MISKTLEKVLGKDILVDTVVEANTKKVEYVIENLTEMDITVLKNLVSRFKEFSFIPAWIPGNLLIDVHKIEGVQNIYKNMPRAIGGCDVESVIPKERSFFTIKDNVLGNVNIPDIELPKNAIEAFNPIHGFLTKAGINPFLKIKIFTTEQTSRILKDRRTRSGRGVKVAILDTGSPQLTYQFAKKNMYLEQYTVQPEPPQDFMGHGCVRGDHKITTNLCGTMTLEEFWNKVDSEVEYVNNGEFKKLNRDDVYVLTDKKPTKVIGVYRTKSRKAVRIHTFYGTIESTTWHKFFVVVPREKWKNGYEIKEMTAEDLYKEIKSMKSKSRKLLLLLPRSDFERFNTKIEGLDENITYLAGLIAADGCVNTNKERNKGRITISSKHREFIERVKEIVEKLGVSCTIKERTSGFGTKMYNLVFYNLEIAKKIEWINRNIRFLGKNFNLLCAWISGFFDGDGSICRYGIKLHNTNTILLEEIMTTLRNLGIHCYISRKRTIRSGKTYETLVIKDFVKELTKYSIHPRRERVNEKKILSEISRSIKELHDCRGVVIKDAEIIEYKEPKYFYDLTTEAGRYTLEGVVIHNSWCHNCVCGDNVPCIYGRITGIANEVTHSIHVKVLNTFPGSGTTWQILKGIEIAVRRGAKVISMSLGGPADGNCITDPEAKVVNSLSKKGVIFSIAAGNSGYNMWTVGSPGISMKAVTVASVSIMDKFKPAWWSSRGPGSNYDKKHRRDFEEVLRKYKDLAIKPDCAATGGGRAFKNAKPDEIIWSGEHGWFEGFYDGIKDTTGGEHGTSQATPHVAGLIACLVSDGIVNNSDDVKKALRDTADEYIVIDPYNTKVDREYVDKYGKSISTGWGLFKLSRFKK